jgi:hypothetical protein
MKVTLQDNGLKYNLFSLDGKKLRSGFIGGNAGLLDFSNFDNGMYLITFYNEEVRNAQMIIIQKQ